MNPNSEKDVGRLFGAMEWSFRQQEPFRNLVRALVAEFAGSGYGQPGRHKYETHLNLMNQTVDSYTMDLVANRPRVSITTEEHGLRDFASRFELAINKLMKEIHLERTLRRAVLDAFFCLGIVKMHLQASPQVRLEGDLVINPAKPFVSNVSIDNFVVDMAARNYSSVQYAGDFYRIPFAALKEEDLYDQAVVRELDLRPTSKWNLGDAERLDRIAREVQTDADELEPMIDVCDVWIPRDHRIYTFPISSTKPFAGNTKAIAVLPWDDPQYGPYPVLSFATVPENVMPASLASHLSPMSRILNNLARKQARRAQAQKENVTYTPAGASDALKLQKSADQQWVAVAEASEIGVHKTGGIDQLLQQYEDRLLQRYDRMAGNLTARMGLGSQTPTARQEEMVQGAVSKKEASMELCVTEFTLSIARQLGFMLWENKFSTIPNSTAMPGLEGNYAPRDMTWTPWNREGSFYDYDLEIVDNSMPYQSLSDKFQTMLSLVQNVFVPASAAMAQQGLRVNYAKIAEKAAEVLNDPELAEFIEAVLPTEAPGGQGKPGMPSSTTREYVRRSVGSGGPEPAAQPQPIQAEETAPVSQAVGAS